jgi:hypothetical protein
VPVKKFDISQHQEVARFLGQTIDAAAERAVLSLALRIVQRIVTHEIPVQHPEPVDRGAYRAGWRAKNIAGGAEVRNTLPYAAVIEWGARAENVKIGRLMIIALSGWVVRKGLIPPQEGKNAAVRRGRVQIAATKMAWAIAMAMKKRGIFNRDGKGLRILEKAMKRADDFFEEELLREIDREYR